jgi:hypothetical protein
MHPNYETTALGLRSDRGPEPRSRVELYGLIPNGRGGWRSAPPRPRKQLAKPLAPKPRARKVAPRKLTKGELTRALMVVDLAEMAAKRAGNRLVALDMGMARVRLEKARKALR